MARAETRTSIALGLAGAALLVLVVILLSAPRADPASSAVTRASSVADRTELALKRGQSLESAARASLSGTPRAAGVVEVIGPDHLTVLARAGTPLSSGSAATAAIKPAGRSVVAGYVLAQASAPRPRQLSSTVALASVAAGIALFALGLVVGGYRRRVSLPERGSSRGSAAAPLVAPVEPPPLPAASETAAKERDALIEECLRVLDHEPDERSAGRLLRALDRVGVEKIETHRGDRFDPRIHQAVAVLDGGGAVGETVAGVVRAGFRDRGRVLREADVQIYRGSAGVGTQP